MTVRPRSISTTVTSLGLSVFGELRGPLASAEARGVDVIPLHIGDTCLPPPPSATFEDALRGQSPSSLYRYASFHGLDDLRQAIARNLTTGRPSAPAIDPEHEVLIGVGGTQALFSTVRAVLDEGDDVLVATPSWPLVPGIVRACGGRPIEVELGYDGAGLTAALTPNTRALYLASPNNPDGAVLSRTALESIARLAEARDLWVFSDEVYGGIVYEGEHVSLASLPGMAARTITIGSISKSHALPGVRVGFAVADAEVIAAARRICTHTVSNVPLICQAVALAAVEVGPDWVAHARDRYREARDAAHAELEGLPLQIPRPAGAFYLFFDLAPILRGRPVKALIERAIDAGVSVAPGAAFGARYATWIRLCFTAAPLPRVVEGVARLKTVLEALA